MWTVFLCPQSMVSCVSTKSHCFIEGSPGHSGWPFPWGDGPSTRTRCSESSIWHLTTQGCCWRPGDVSSAAADRKPTHKPSSYRADNWSALLFRVCGSLAKWVTLNTQWNLYASKVTNLNEFKDFSVLPSFTLWKPKAVCVDCFIRKKTRRLPSWGRLVWMI